MSKESNKRKTPETETPTEAPAKETQSLTLNLNPAPSNPSSIVSNLSEATRPEPNFKEIFSDLLKVFETKPDLPEVVYNNYHFQFIERSLVVGCYGPINCPLGDNVFDIIKLNSIPQPIWIHLSYVLFGNPLFNRENQIFRKKLNYSQVICLIAAFQMNYAAIMATILKEKFWKPKSVYLSFIEICLYRAELTEVSILTLMKPLTKDFSQPFIEAHRKKRAEAQEKIDKLLSK